MSLLTRFSVFGLLAVAGMALVLAQALHSQIRHRALSDASRTAEAIARFGIQPQLSQADLGQAMSPEAVASIDALLSAGYDGAGIVRIRVWNRAPRVVYSNVHGEIGADAVETGDLAAALRGRRRAHVAAGPGGRPVIEATVPLRFAGGGAPAGAFQMQLDYAPVAAAIRSDSRRLYVLLALGALALFLALYRIIANASRTLREQAEENARQARHDALTGLPNRTLFYECVAEAIAADTRAGGRSAVMLIDLDRFKEVNDTLGHHAGDLLLQEVGRRLGNTVRDGDVFARLGGDEFAVLLRGIRDVDAAQHAAARIATALEHSLVLQGFELHVDASIGIAVYPDHGGDVEELLQRADVAMYLAKAGSAQAAVYSPAEDPYSPARLRMIAELRDALEGGGGLELHYQPKADLRTGRVESVEALARWRHPRDGLIAAGAFIPVAERTGLIEPLTRWVLDEALRQCASWRAAGRELAVAVNVSARSLVDEDLPDLVAALLERHEVPAGLLRLEITESVIMGDPDLALRVLTRVHEMGVSLSIDDFGTGYSSLGYLQRLPVGELKIDRSFVAELDAGTHDAFIVRATIDLARNLGLQVVAEGVESERSWTALQALGCDLAQGYHLSRPVPAAELEHWLAAPPALPVPG